MKETVNIAIASSNPVKINAVKESFLHYYNEVNVYTFDVESDVPSQPFNEDTFKGAKSRAENLYSLKNELIINCDFFIGIEGGVINYFNNWFGLGVICIIDKNKNCGYGTSPLFPLPEKVINKLKEGKELGEVMDEIQNEFNTKQKQGAVGYLTNGILNRKDLYIPGIISALIPFNNKKIFKI